MYLSARFAASGLRRARSAGRSELGSAGRSELGSWVADGGEARAGIPCEVASEIKHISRIQVCLFTSGLLW